MKAKIDKKLCKYCDFGDKDNELPDGSVPCIAQVDWEATGNKGQCKFDK